MYVPPASGIAVAISDFERAAGTTSSPASAYARITAGPAISKASAGRMKIPLPIIAPMLIASTEASPKSRSSSFTSPHRPSRTA
jgi:hypothetical protein